MCEISAKYTQSEDKTLLWFRLWKKEREKDCLGYFGAIFQNKANYTSRRGIQFLLEIDQFVTVILVTLGLPSFASSSWLKKK